MTAHTEGRALGTGASPWLFIEGVVALVLGAAALILPGIAGIAGALVAGWVLLLAGGLGIVSVVSDRNASHVAWSVVSSIAALIAGGLLILNPVFGTVSLVIVIAAYLVVDGIAMIALAIEHRRRDDRGWAWLALTGVLDIAVGVLLGVFGPGVAPWVIGVIVGVDLMLAGAALIAIGVSRNRRAGAAA